MSMRRGVFSPWAALGVVVAVGLVASGVVYALPSWGSDGGADGTTDGPGNDPPTPDTEVVDALLRAGLDAETLTAAGVTTDAAVDQLVSNVRAHLVTELDDLQAADAEYATQKVLVDQLRRKVRSGLATQEEVQDLATAKAALATATTTRDTAVQSLFDAATANLDEGVVTTLETIRANRSWKLPVEFLTGSRTQQEWVDLRAALANERISAGYPGEEIDPECATLLSTCRGEQCVSNARSNLDTHCGHIQAQWDQSCAEQ